MYDNIICNIPVVSCLEVIDMPTKLNDIYRQNIISLYKSFVSIKDIATRLSINHKSVRKVLQSVGIDTTPRKNINPPDLQQVIELYNQGIGVRGIAERLGFNRRYMIGFFDRNGIKRRNPKEQQIERMKHSTPEQIAHLIKKAHEVARGRKRSFEELCNSAITRYKTQSFTNSKYESRFSKYLATQNIKFVRQFPCGPYNLDFLIGNIAVEIFGGNWHHGGYHLSSFAKRTKYVLNSGYFLICIFVSESKGDNFEAIIHDKFIPIFNMFSGDKTGITKYCIIRSHLNKKSEIFEQKSGGT
jgi:transposase-like protein/very-short-patch-repair endonuclease